MYMAKYASYITYARQVSTLVRYQKMNMSMKSNNLLVVFEIRFMGCSDMLNYTTLKNCK